MSHCCSQCSFTAQFESALRMHHQLHHETVDEYPIQSPKLKKKINTIPRASLEAYPTPREKGFRLASRTSSATRLFDKLRARICRSRTLFSHPEENEPPNINDLSVPSECTSKALKVDSTLSKCSALTALRETHRETYGCHLCSFEADRITILDRHLLNDHKIGLDNLLKLVMAKTKDGLNEDSPEIFGIRQPYYKATEDIIEEGEFVIETVTPKIKILRHAATNTEIQWSEIPDLKNNCRIITKELQKLMKYPMDCNKDSFLAKMNTLNECMCKFVDSSNTLKRVLTKEFEAKSAREGHGSCDEPFFSLGLGDQETPREWERAHSEKIENNRNRVEKTKFSSESFYF